MAEPPGSARIVPFRGARGLRGWLDAALIELFPSDPDDLLERDGTIGLKASRRTRVFAVTLGEWALVVKRHRTRGLWRRTVSPFRASRARAASVAATALRRAGVRVPAPRGVLEARRAGFLSHGFLVSDRVTDAVTLHAFLEGTGAGDRRRLAVARRLGRLVGRMHRAGFRHRDLKTPNFLVDGRHRVWLVDLDGARRVGRRRIDRGRDLARLRRDVGQPAPAEARAFVAGYRVGRGRRGRRVIPRGA